MRRPYFAGNWKMHMTASQASTLAEALVQELSGVSNKLMLAPSFTSIPAVAKALQGSNILLGAQNMAPEESGAHTGEVSPIMLTDAGVTVVILGHSERRHVYGETDELINRKVKLALSHGLEVILCLGETLEQRDAGSVDEVVTRQLESGLEGVDEGRLGAVTIAYEPVWAIGTGRTATPEDADAVHTTVRSWFAERYSQAASDAVCIQYGGSVKPDNVEGLMAKPNVDGALVGGASLKVDSFSAIARAGL
ncbi:MAG: triose-phosphate isomerase [Spirochaetales bacterium]